MTRLSGNNQNRTVLIVGTLIAAALIGLALFAVRGRQAGNTAGEAKFTYANLPYEGQASAPVNVLVVEDFKCPVCKQFEEGTMPELRTKYVETGKAKVYSLVWPFLAERLPEDDSKYAAQAAKCMYDLGGNEAFSQYKTLIFRAQGDERTVWATKGRLKALAESMSVDQNKFATCLDTDATAARVDADEAEANAAGVQGTPAVFVNGKRIESNDPAVIGKAIEEAQSGAAQSGTTQSGGN